MHRSCRLFWIGLLSLGGVGCRNSSPAESVAGDSASQWVAERVFFKAYQTKTPDTIYQDTVWLRLHAEGPDTVRGTYQWLVPGKDGKNGMLEGRLEGQGFYGLYHYQQEGGQYTDSIQISFSGGSAVVTQRQASGVPLIDTLESSEQ